MPVGISDSYIELNKALHSDLNFGNRADCGGLASRLPITLSRLHERGVCNSFIDYGCGKGKLVSHLRTKLPPSIVVDGYDPAMDEFSNMPSTGYDFLACFDVLEHIEAMHIDNVLGNIRSLTSGIAYLVVDLQPAVKKLENGRNAHILLAPPDWWTIKIAQYFSSQISFPIKHLKGFNQKMIYLCTNELQLIDHMLYACNKIKVHKTTMQGGIPN